MMLSSVLLTILQLAIACSWFADGMDCIPGADCKFDKDKAPCYSAESASSILGLTFKRKMQCASNGHVEVRACRVVRELTTGNECWKNGKKNCEGLSIKPGETFSVYSGGAGQSYLLGSIGCTDAGATAA